MVDINDILLLAGVAIAMVMLVVVTRMRRRSYARHLHELAQEQVCEHLRPALEALLSRGHQVRRVGQRNPELPLEIHVQPPFDPKAVLEELKLAPPVHLSAERNVLYCQEDWCEIHPVG